MKYGSLSASELNRSLGACKDSIISGNGVQESLIVTLTDIINILSAVPTLKLEELKDVAFSIKDKLNMYLSSKDYICTIRNILTDLIAPNEQVILVPNGPNFFSDVTNKVGVSKANDIIIGTIHSDNGSEFVLLSIYPERNKIRVYGRWDPIGTALTICFFALFDMDLLPKRLKILMEKGIRVDEEEVPEDYLKYRFSKSFRLSGDSSEY